MSFSLNVPRQNTVADFDTAVYSTVESPKADGRTKIGKRQKMLVEVAKEALVSMAYDLGGEPDGFCGSISGHIAPDLSGNVAINISVLGPEIA